MSHGDGAKKKRFSSIPNGRITIPGTKKTKHFEERERI